MGFKKKKKSVPRFYWWERHYRTGHQKHFSGSPQEDVWGKQPNPKGHLLQLASSSNYIAIGIPEVCSAKRIWRRTGANLVVKIHASPRGCLGSVPIRFLLTHTLGRPGWWLQPESPRHPHGKPGLSLSLQFLASTSAQFWMTQAFEPAAKSAHVHWLMRSLLSLK